MPYPIRHLHHVTATVDEAQPDIDFCEATLGLRLVKRTVNFDNHNVYHFYYGTEVGAPGTIWTTFPYHGWGVPAGIHGAGQIVATAFSVSEQALEAWGERFERAGVEVCRPSPRFGREVLEVRDPSGLRLELAGDPDDRRPPWVGGDPAADTAIRGLHSVTLLLHARQPTIAFMRERLGFEVVAESGERTRLAVGGATAGHFVDLVEDLGAPAARNGLGTVHHVAFAIDGDEAQMELRQELLGLGLSVTDIRDRTYFRSIYFREPGGVLFEVATMRPGFTVDEPLEALGESLRLPPWEEPHRASIEAALPAIVVHGPGAR
jgi:glyoxalase family protein